MRRSATTELARVRGRGGRQSASSSANRQRPSTIDSTSRIAWVDHGLSVALKTTAGASWMSSSMADSIEASFSGSHSARQRSPAVWIVGMNLPLVMTSTAVSVASCSQLSDPDQFAVGRARTRTAQSTRGSTAIIDAVSIPAERAVSCSGCSSNRSVAPARMSGPKIPIASWRTSRGSACGLSTQKPNRSPSHVTCRASVG